MARRPLQDPHIVPRPRLGHRRRGRRRHRAIKTSRAPKGADAYYRPARPQRPEPGSPLRLLGASSSPCIHSKCPRPPAAPVCIPGTDAPQLACDPGSSVGEGPDPAPARQFCRVPSLLTLPTLIAASPSSKCEKSGRPQFFLAKSRSAGKLPAAPRTQRRLSRLAGAGCLCVFLARCRWR